MVCWNDSIARSVELDGGEDVFMKVCELRLVFSSDAERAIAAPVLIKCSSCCTTGNLAVGLVVEGAPLATFPIA